MLIFVKKFDLIRLQADNISLNLMFVVMTNILLAQINPIVGAIEYNTQMIINIINNYHNSHDIIIFPELSITGYPPEDLLLYPSFIQKADDALVKIMRESKDLIVIVGCIQQINGSLFNSAAIIQAQKIQFYHKQSLPNYGVFDEHRYFTKGNNPPFTFKHRHHQFGVVICEDVWQEDSRESIINCSMQTLIVLNASPYEKNKPNQRLKILEQFTNQGLNVLYLNQVGGQDELVFDGQSLALDNQHGLIATGQAFKQDLLSIQVIDKGLHAVTNILQPTPLEEMYQALCLGLKDFLEKNKVTKVVLGLSGGIDSALCLAIATDSLGPENVHALIMPSKYSAKMSSDDAMLQANILGISYEVQPINNLVLAFENALPKMKNTITAQNIQARIRGMLLMAYANEHQAMVLSTSNKSEAAVGYCTLYGDMCGGLAILKDVYKTEVYALARFRNTLSSVIPENVITRPPSAELAPDQKDEDDLPPYDLLDAILKDMIENRLSTNALLAKGYEPALIKRIQTRLKSSEFKRFQAAPGLKLGAVGFTKDWRMPISNGWFDY